MQDLDDALGLRPLTARSVILSVLLGTHPPHLPVRTLVRTAELFGISEGTTRVALSRLCAEGDVVAEDRGYRLTARLLTRQRRQDEGHHPETKPWDGQWEIAVAAPKLRSAAERLALGNELVTLRLAELRQGVWVRPANLTRAWPAELEGRALQFVGSAGFGVGSLPDLAANLWDLDAWARRASDLIASMGRAADRAQRFMLATAMVRHFADDPVLPDQLLPSGWPGERLRQAYADYEAELAEMLSRERSRHS